jgi:HD-GYP domain-containing protein (c-di-GMP phosphodiesterase class II)
MFWPWILSTTFLAAWLLSLWLLRQERKNVQDEQHQGQAKRERVERELAHQQGLLDRWVGFLKRLHEHSLSPSGQLTKQELAESVLDAVRLLTGARLSVLLETTADTQNVVPLASRGLSPQQVAALRIRFGDNVLGQVAAKGIPVIRNDVSLNEEPVEGFLKPPYVVLPILIPLRLTGVLVLAQPQQTLFDPEALRLVDAMTQEAGLLFGYLGLLQDVYNANEGMTSALAQALSVREDYAPRHLNRTQTLIRSMARELHLPEFWIQQIEHGALLHDVGKIGIPDAILKKPGKLTPEEYDIMKHHSSIGYRILAPIPFLRPAASIVRHHQEWHNGKGYPDGLAGEEIPLGARMVSILDAWDAMTSDRVPRKALIKTSAITELRRQAGTQFDPKLVDIFLRVIEDLERKGVATTENADGAVPAAPGPHA